MWKPFGVASPFVPGNDNTSLILGFGLSSFSVRKGVHAPTKLKKLKRALSSSISTRNGSLLFRYRCGKSLNSHVTERLGEGTFKKLSLIYLFLCQGNRSNIKLTELATYASSMHCAREESIRKTDKYIMFVWFLHSVKTQTSSRFQINLDCWFADLWKLWWKFLQASKLKI